MAGDWIKMETMLHEKPEVIQIAAELGMDRYSVVGRLHRLWSWFNAQSCDGHARGVTDVFVDELVSCDGFARMLRKVDWLEVRSGSLLVPHFDRHNGESAKKRAVQNERKRRERKSRSEGDKCHAPSVTDRGQNDDQRREEKRREDNNTRKAENPRFSEHEFDQFWKVVTKRKGKDDAKKAFLSQRKQHSLEHIVDMAKAYYSQPVDNQFLKHPGSFLRQYLNDDPSEWTSRENKVDRFLEGVDPL